MDGSVVDGSVVDGSVVDGSVVDSGGGGGGNSAVGAGGAGGRSLGTAKSTGVAVCASRRVEDSSSAEPQPPSDSTRLRRSTKAKTKLTLQGIEAC